VSEARISGPTDDLFTASIEQSFRGDRVELDARPSDAIMLALQAGAPIWIAQASMNRAGVVLQIPPEPGAA
jgi:bifunctional DNase/RNase